ncbi:hypothetical protein PSTT_04863 [Puccinia striiformis]|uniref:Uncharacterized protein n=1 Tax=Puccinia striiformis TaxID=27350 RepID=A0A2S4VRH2_9BASI|nr:hypothetical protein PSTT_04863 [Puccinia striiformis]
MLPVCTVMAKLTHLPAELVHRIIDLLINQYYTHSDAHHHDLDHHGIQEERHRSRPHLELKDSFDIRYILDNPNDSTSPRESETLLGVSWPQGKPADSCKPHLIQPWNILRLRFYRSPIQSTFAIEALFKNVELKNRVQATVFHEALTRPSPTNGPENTRGPPDTPDRSNVQTTDIQLPGINPSGPNRLARHVRSLQFTWTGPCSMTAGGGSLICDIIRCCPFLENIAISPIFLVECKEPIFEALASRKLIKEFVVLGNVDTDPIYFQWDMDEFYNRLFSKWACLDTIELVRLSRRPTDKTKTIPQSIPVLNLALRTIILKDPHLDENSLACLLKGTMETLRTLKLIDFLSSVDRAGLYRILTECTSPDLEVLTIEIDYTWDMIKRGDENSKDPSRNGALMDLVFKNSSALRKLKCLSIAGFIVGPEFLELLPQSLVKLAWDETEITSAALVKVLWSSHQQPQDTRDGPGTHHQMWLPNLKCLSVRDDNKWHCRDRKAVEEALKVRGVCFHPICGRSYGSQFDDDGPIIDHLHRALMYEY